MIDKDLLSDCLTGLDFPADVHRIVEQSEVERLSPGHRFAASVLAKPHLRVP